MKRSVILSVAKLLFLFLPLYRSDAQSLEKSTLAYYKYSADTGKINTMIRLANDLEQQYPDSAANLYHHINNVSAFNSYSRGIATAHFGLGKIFLEKGKDDSALVYFVNGLVYCDTFNDKDLLSTFYSGIGLLYKKTGEYHKSMAYFMKAQRYVEDKPEVYTTLFNNIATVLGQMLQYDRAIEYIDKALPYAVSTGNVRLQCALLANKAKCYFQLEQYDESLDHFYKALSLAKQEKLYPEECVIIVGLSAVYINKGEVYKALPLLQAAKKLEGLPRVGPETMNDLLGATGIVQAALQNYQEAIRILLEAYEGAYIGNKLYYGSELARIYAKTEDYKKAYEWKDKMSRLKDSMEIKQVAMNVTEMEAKLGLTERDKVIADNQLLIAAQADRLKNRNMLIIAMVLIMILSISLLFIISRNNKKKRIIDVQQSRLEQLALVMQGEENERGRLARELHDGIGGMLASIKMNLGAIRTEHPEFEGLEKLNGLSLMLDETSGEVRKTAHNLMPDILTKHNLTEALSLYCGRIKAGSDIDIDLQFHDLPENMPKSTELFLYRTVQELIQNVIKHAGASQISVQLIYMDNNLSITVEDNGTGFDINEKHNGTGLDNLRYRIRALHGEIHIFSSKGTGTTVLINFDYTELNAGQMINHQTDV